MCDRMRARVSLAMYIYLSVLHRNTLDAMQQCESQVAVLSHMSHHLHINVLIRTIYRRLWLNNCGLFITS